MTGWRTLLLWGGLVAALAAANAGIARHERTLAEGRVVLLELAPVDPRSLMQGDYMRLRFAVSEQVMETLAARAGLPPAPVDGSVDDTEADAETRLARWRWRENAREDGYLVLRQDAAGVGRFVRLQAAPRPQAQGEVAVRYRLRNGEVRIASDAWFFEEGQAQRFEAARFGELRVTDGGQALLAGLRDGKHTSL